MGGRLQPRTLSVTLDGNGNGTVGFSIDNANTEWLVDAVAVSTNQAQTATPVPTASTYKNTIGPAGAQGGTNSGNFDTGQGTCALFNGDVLYVVWSGGIPGTIATATIGGQFTQPGEDPI
jgi:hypothetical protein